VLVAWARSAEAVQIQIAATSDEAQFVDQYGKMMTLRPFNGNYMLTLPGAICNTVDGCPVGGMVSMLIQTAGADTLVEEISAAGITPLVFG
jgi:hypothetical protein